MVPKNRRSVVARVIPAAAIAACCGSAVAQYVQTDLVSDQAGVALHQDTHLVNPWGVAFNPTAVAWVADNATGFSTLYDGAGTPQSLIVTVPTPTAPDGGSPTGVVFNGTQNFMIQGGPALFLFCTEGGVISAWNPTVATPPTISVRVIDSSAGGAVYKGLAISQDGHLLAADFHNGRVDAFNSDFSPNHSFQFVDPTLPAQYAPFNVWASGSRVYVAYAMQDAMGHDDVPGPGHGFVDVFHADGTFDRRLVSQGVLNSPWGMAIAPEHFGTLSHALLIGNFGDGRINAFDPDNGNSLGTLNDENGAPIEIDGLWGIEFGNGVRNQPTNTLFFAAGPDDESHGLYGRLDVVCYANCDRSIVSPVLNVNDFLCFMSKFAAGDSTANCDNSTQPPVLNVADFMCFMDRFAEGCPG